MVKLRKQGNLGDVRRALQTPKSGFQKTEKKITCDLGECGCQISRIFLFGKGRDINTHANTT